MKTPYRKSHLFLVYENKFSPWNQVYLDFSVFLPFYHLWRFYSEEEKNIKMIDDTYVIHKSYITSDASDTQI